MDAASPAAADARPRVVAGLRLVRRVGRGGEGEVWEARDAEGRRRALKLVRPEALASPAELARRGAYLRRLDHPALVAVHRTGRLTGSVLEGWGFLEMDFVEGESLAEAPADPDALERLTDLADGLDLLHAGRWSDGVPLVHRDVKPANLIATPSGAVVLVDCSTLRGTDATQLTRIGTPRYAAPEVLTGRAGPPADVYSFGATVVALATGARGEALDEVLADPGALALPAAVGAALDPDPSRRPSSCKAVLTAGAGIDLDALPDLRTAGWSRQAAWRGRDGADVDPARRAGKPGAWFGALSLGMATAALAAVGLLGGTASRLDGLVATWPLLAAAVAAVLLVAGARLGGASLRTALLANPVAWGWVLGGKAAAAGRSRAWVRTTTSGALLVVAAVVALVAAVVIGIADVDLPGAGQRLGAPAALLGAGPLAAAVAGAGAASGVGGVLARILLAPLWLAGAVVLLAAGALAALAGLLVGRPGPGSRLVAGTLAGGLGTVAPRAGGPVRRAPDPRA
ncbi:MAG: serine/threonine-protein kinase [Actinomycetota bacterium]